jgi:hypothetical protein
MVTICWDGGGCLVEESDELKRKFETEFGGDKLKLLKYNDMAFRWTCCGLNARHGNEWLRSSRRLMATMRARLPCGCDFFCHMGKPLPDRLVEKRKRPLDCSINYRMAPIRDPLIQSKHPLHK